MKIAAFLLLLIAFTSSTRLRGNSPAATQSSTELRENSEVTVFVKALSDKREIAVVRGASVSVSDLIGIHSDAIIADSVCAYTIRVELRLARGAPIVLWSRLKRDPGTLPGFDALDLSVEPDRIVLVTGEFGGISIWKIDLIQEVATCADINADDWNGIGAAIPYSRDNVKAKIVPATKGHKLAVEFETLGKTAKSFGRYEQVGEEWKFKLVLKQAYPPTCVVAER